MTITRYLQLYGIQDVAIYTFESIPVESIADVLESECKECYLTNYNQLGVYITAIENGKYFAVIAVKGGYGAAQKNKTESQIEEIINVI